jgi:hypothetical protein
VHSLRTSFSILSSFIGLATCFCSVMAPTDLETGAAESAREQGQPGNVSVNRQISAAAQIKVPFGFPRWQLRRQRKSQKARAWVKVHPCPVETLIVSPFCLVRLPISRPKATVARARHRKSGHYLNMVSCPQLACIFSSGLRAVFSPSEDLVHPWASFGH